VSLAAKLVAPDVMVAPLLTTVAPVGLFTVTAKTALPLAPGANVPKSKVQGLTPQFQPGVLAPALKVVSAGITSVSVTVSKETVPVF
jgi:hypothetical protein